MRQIITYDNLLIQLYGYIGRRTTVIIKFDGYNGLEIGDSGTNDLMLWGNKDKMCFIKRGIDSSYRENYYRLNVIGTDVRE
jgi:hypothetical protein